MEEEDDDADDDPICVVGSCDCPGIIAEASVCTNGPTLDLPTKLLLVPIISDKISKEFAMDFSDKWDAPESSDRSEPEPLRLRLVSDRIIEPLCTVEPDGG